MKNDIRSYLKLTNEIGVLKQASPDQTAPGSLEKGSRWKEHTLEALAHLRRSGYSV